MLEELLSCFPRVCYSAYEVHSTLVGDDVP